MHVYYCDAGLVADRGHNATHCRGIVRALRSLGVETTVLAHHKVAANLVEQVGARKAFSMLPYERTSQDELCGWLKSFSDVSTALSRDFGRAGIGPDSVVLYDTALPGPMLGLINWLQRTFRPERSPRVFMSLMEHSGMRASFHPDGRRELRPGAPEPTLYRYASACVNPAFASRFSWGAYDPTLAEVYSALLKRPVRDLPNPIRASTSRRDRGGTRSWTIGFLGAQRPNKGFHLVPEIATLLFARRKDVRLLVQNSWSAMREETAKLAEWAKSEPRLELLDGAKDEAGWAALLDRCDLLVAPYDLSQYALCCSGMMLEGVANAIPVALAADSASARVLQGFGMPGTQFKSVDAVSVVNAIEAALADYDALAARAVQASAQWEKEQGPDCLAKALLEVLAEPGDGRTP